MCILLVEDEFLIRFILAEELAEAGFAVCEADSGDHASALFAAQPDLFSLLVTDVHMPGTLDGIGVAHALRERRPDIPVIYMTGRPDVVDGATQLGNETVLLAKPFTPSELLAATRQLLGKAQENHSGS